MNLTTAGLALTLLAGCAASTAPTPESPAVAPVVVLPERPAPAEPKRPTVPAGFVELEVGGVIVVDDRPAVILVDASHETAMPIFIGGTEALAIDLRLHKQHYPRPLTHDLLDQMLDKLGARLVKIHIGSIRDDTFIGTLFVQRADHVFRFDARPSDAIALALGHDVPIFVSVEVVAQAGIKKEELLNPGDSAEPAKPPDSI